MSYIPEPGSVPEKVIAYLHSKPKGYACCERELADVCQKESGRMKAYLVAAIRNGIVVQVWTEGYGRKCYALAGTPSLPEPTNKRVRDSIPRVRVRRKPRPAIIVPPFPMDVPTSIWDLASKPIQPCFRGSSPALG